MQPLSANPSEADLARQAAWMRRLARALTADPSAADDVAQDAWLKLARRPAPVGEGYVAAVVRSLARTRWRGEARRAAREAVVARAEALPSAAEIGARVEIARRVAQALEELAEPYRTTLVLRYHDDLSAAEIARRRGVPAATVRSQLKRGLEELRARLDERGGGREVWLPALLPLARGEGALPGALATSLTGVLAVKLAFAGVFAAALVVLAWRFAAGGGPPDATAHAPSPVAATDESSTSPGHAPFERAVPDRAVVAAEDLAAREGGDSRTSSEDALAVRARAVDGVGRPIAGAWLASRWLEGRSDLSATDGRLELTLDRAHAERWAGSGADRRLELQIGAPGMLTRTLTGSIAASQSILEFGDVALEPGGALLGRVLDEHGLGVEDALLLYGTPDDPTRDDENRSRLGPADLRRLMQPSVQPEVLGRSGPGGAFLLEGIPAGHGTLWARTERSLWAWSEPLGLRAGETLSGIEITVRDAPQRVISGRVVDPRGVALPGLKILASDIEEVSAGWEVARTDAAGRFHFVPRLDSVKSLHVESPDWEWDDIARTDVAAGTHDLELAFEASSWLYVVVRGPDGRPLTDGSVQGLPAEGPTDQMLPRCESTLDADGRGRLRRLAGSLRVRAQAPGHRSQVLGPFDGATFPEPLEVVLEPLAALGGRVLRADGAPAAGARVSLHRGATTFLTHQGFDGDGEPFVYALIVEPAAAVTADENGRFRLPLPGVDPSATGEVARRQEALAGLGYATPQSQVTNSRPEQTWYVHASLSGQATHTSGPHRFEGAEPVELELRLPPAGAIEGRLELADGRSPAGWTMGASDGLAQIAASPVAADGRFRFDDLHPGPWQVRAYAPGTRPWPGGGRLRSERAPTPDVVVDAGGVSVYVHRQSVQPLARLSGRLSIDGAPPGAWRVALRATSPRGVVRSDESTLDPDGRFELTLEPQGGASLELQGPFGGSSLWVHDKLDLSAGENAWDIELRTARLQGWIEPGRTTKSFFGSMHYVHEQGSLQVRTPIAPDADGRFGPLPVGAGRGVLLGPRSEARQPAPVWAELDLAPGEARTLDLR